MTELLDAIRRKLRILTVMMAVATGLELALFFVTLEIFMRLPR